MFRRLAIVMALLGTLATSLIPSGGQAQSGSGEWDGSIIANGGWRVEVVAAAQGPSISDADLDRSANGEWLLVVADVTNWTGNAGTLPMDELTVGTSGGNAASTTGTVLTDLNLREGPALDALILTGMPAGATVEVTGEAENGFYPVVFDGLAGYASVDGITVEGDVAATGGSIDADGSVTAASALDISDGGDDIDANATVRIAMAFSVPVDADAPVLTFGSTLPLADALAAEVEVTSLGEVESPSLALVEIESVQNDGAVVMADESRASLIGVDVPDDGACFHQEAINELRKLRGGVVYFESAIGSTEDEAIGYLWAKKQGRGRVLVNHELIRSGFADTSFAGQDDLRLQPWFTSTRDQVKVDEVGLWSACTGFNGDERPELTVAPTPTPDAAEVRAEYQSIDPGALPGEYFLEDVSFSGIVVFVVPLRPARAAGDLGNVRVSSVIEIISTAYDGSPTITIVGFNGSTSGIAEGSSVTVYGTGAGTFTGPNGNGNIIVLPYVIAKIIDLA